MKLTIFIAIISALCWLLTGCSSYYSGPASDHFDGSRFFNPGKPMEKSFGAFLKWRLTGERIQWPDFQQLAHYDHPPQRVMGTELRISMVGHATVLIQTQGVNILTDPIWSARASPVSWAGPSRVHPPGIAMDELPPIDLVLISHNHYDHLDLATIGQLWHRFQPRIIVPLGNDEIIKSYDTSIVCEPYDWGDAVRISDGLTVYLEPMHHWSKRTLFDTNRALWAAYVLATDGGNIYFVGDSGYGGGDYFRAAREKYQDFRLAILPIGDYRPRWFMAYGHMAPDEVLRAYDDLGKPLVLAIHHMVFPLADTGYGEPREEMLELLTGQPGAEDFRLLSPGEYWLLDPGKM